jgi:hypothetical protein
MNVFEKIMAVYPELTSDDFVPYEGVIHLVDDGDGIAYIAKWDYSKSIPKGLKLGK